MAHEIVQNRAVSVRLISALYAFSIIICLNAAIAVGQDYWVYIRKDTKITDYNDPSQIAGRSDIGDIVDIISTNKYTPTIEEKKIYKIIKIQNISDIDKLQLKDTIRKPKLPTQEHDPVLKYRRYNVDIKSIDEKDKLKENTMKGIFDKYDIQENIKDKINNLSINYDSDK